MFATPFAFRSENLPKLKAKQLSKVFPYLKLAVAQEATAQALGYVSWYKCVHRDKAIPPSISDQVAGLPIRTARYYHQANTLVAFGIAPVDADRWVRAWGLTGQPSLAPADAEPIYYEWAHALALLDAGKLSDEQLVAAFSGDLDYSKYPEVDRPERVCPGVILGPLGRYPYYAVDHLANARIPGYLRGPQSLYHCEDDLDILSSCIPGFSAARQREARLHDLNFVQHEWHYGESHPRSTCSGVQALIAAALARPRAMVVISQRAMPASYLNFDFSRCALACLRGVDFAAFLQQKGVLNPRTVVWYDNVPPIHFNLALALLSNSLNDFSPQLPVFEAAEARTPCPPVYSYPFKAFPMSAAEYSSHEERSGLLALALDYPSASDGDPDDGSENPVVPKLPDRTVDLLPA